MNKIVDTPKSEIKNLNGVFYLIGAVLGGLTGGLVQESFGATVVGALLGVGFAAFFILFVLKHKPHDR